MPDRVLNTLLVSSIQSCSVMTDLKVAVLKKLAILTQSVCDGVFKKVELLKREMKEG